MKTALEWAEYLPLQIKLWFIEECERQEAHFTCEYPSLVDAICGELFDWSYTEFGYEFWDFVWHIALDYQGREAEILSDYLDESVPYTKEEVEAMILEYADPNDEVCKVMLANVGKTKEATLANQLTYEALSLSNKNLIIEIGEITKENEALKSTIEGLTKENTVLISETQRLNAIVENQKMEIALLKANELGKYEYAKGRIIESEKFVANDKMSTSELKARLNEIALNIVHSKDVQFDHAELLYITSLIQIREREIRNAKRNVFPSLLQRFINWLS